MKKLWTRALPLLLCLVALLTVLPMQKVQAAEETAMKASDAYIKLLKSWEGFRSTPYWDVSHYSIGYGTTCPDSKVDYYTKNPITEAEAEAMMRSSLAGFENSVNNYAKKHGLVLKQQQFDALVSFTYNCGASWMNELNGYFNTAVRYGDTGRLFMYGIGLYSNAGGDYILMRRRMREANIYINGQYTSDYPSNYRWVFLNGGGAKPRYPIYCFDANKPEELKIRFTNIPEGKAEDGSTFVYEFAGWYTEDGKEVTKTDTSLERGQILYARWKDPDGKVATLPIGTPVKEQKLTIVKDKANIRNGPGTYYDKTGELKKDATLTLKEVYTVGSTTWGNTNKGWLSLANTDYVPPKDTYPKTGKVNASGVNYRKGPGTSYSSYGKMSKNEKITITEVNDDSSWGKFTKDGKTCWISLKYVDFDAKTVSKLELLKLPDKLNYANYKRPLELEGSMIRITYGDGTHEVRSIAMSDVDDDRTAQSTSATVTATVGGKSVSFKVYFGKYVELKITQQPVDVYVEAGEHASTPLVAQGEGLSYQWYLKNPGATAYTTSSVKSSVYSYTMTEEKSGRKVYCIVTDKYGSSVKSDVVTLKIPEVVSILEQPADVKAKDGKPLTVKMKLAGDGLTYQWYYQDPNGEPQKSSVTTAEYTTTMSEDKDGRKVFCEITDRYGNKVTSDAATMILAPDLVITQQPADATAEAGERVGTTVKATGDGLTYQWYLSNPGMTGFAKSSKVTDTYDFTMSEEMSGRRVYCVITDAYGDSVTTDIATLKIPSVFAITQQPASVTVEDGKSFTIRFTATGDGLTYKWYYKNKGESQFLVTNSFTGNSYSTTMTNARDGRQIYCVVTDKYGNTLQTDTVTMTMKDAVKAAITQQPTSVTVENGESFTIRFTAIGDGLTYKWYYKNKGESKFLVTNTFTGNSYTTTMNDARDGRQVYCVVTDKYGNTAKTDTVTMTMKTTASKVAITKQPASVTVENGKSFTIRFTATGDGLTYKWYYKNKGESKFLVTNSFTGNSYTTTMTDARNGRQVYCEVTDKYGNTAKTDTVTMTMKATSSKVTITKQPVSAAVAKGKRVTVSVAASGSGLSYQWYYKDTDDSKFYKSTNKTSTYSTTMKSSRDGRLVYCIVKDKYGNTAKSVTVTLSIGNLKITQQPKNVKVPVGERATTTIAASGEGLKYQWYLSNPGMTGFAKSSITSATYGFTMTEAMSGRRVYCVVTDKYGNTVKTNTVTMSVTAISITQQPTDMTVAEGEVVSAKVVASGEGLKYQWYLSNAGMTGFAKSSVTTDTYSYVMTAAKADRRVYCVITDKNGDSVTTQTVTFKMS